MAYTLLCSACDGSVGGGDGAGLTTAGALLCGRWRCAQCDSFDACAACVRAGLPHLDEHCFLHITRPKGEPLDGVVFVNPSMVAPVATAESAVPPVAYLCDGCETGIAGARFVCTSCVDFDLCEVCYTTKHDIRRSHDVSHVFLRIPVSHAGRVLLGDYPRLHASLLALLAPVARSASMLECSDATAVLRRYTLADLPAVTAVEEECFGDDAWSADALTRLMVPKYNDLMDVLETYAAPGSGPARVEATPTLVGYAAYKLISDGKYGYVSSLGVRRGYRGRGYANTLLRHVLLALQRRRCTSVRLHVAPTNAPAIALYIRLGFTVVHLVRGYYGHRKDALLMARPLPFETEE